MNIISNSLDSNQMTIYHNNTVSYSGGFKRCLAWKKSEHCRSRFKDTCEYRENWS